jgi:hypothetical protein
MYTRPPPTVGEETVGVPNDTVQLTAKGGGATSVFEPVRAEFPLNVGQSQADAVAAVNRTTAATMPKRFDKATMYFLPTLSIPL